MNALLRGAMLGVRGEGGDLLANIAEERQIRQSNSVLVSRFFRGAPFRVFNNEESKMVRSYSSHKIVSLYSEKHCPRR